MTERILIVDDEEHIRRMMRITLEAAGYAAGEAADGVEGVRLFGDGTEWNCVVLDQRMPGMDGLETLKRIKERDPKARVIMATAYASIELAVEAMKLGAADFVRKPMTPQMFRNAVAAALAKPAAIDRAPSSPAIETITMNGFSIIDSKTDAPEQRRFTVMSPGGTSHELLVEIDKEVVDYVARLVRRPLPLESSFWTEEARRVLADYLWTKGEAPLAGKLVLDHLDRDAILVAEHWEE